VSQHEKFMAAALKEAGRALELGEVPVGAVAVVDGKIIARAHNKRETLSDPTAHAEILCIQKAAKKLGGWRLNGVVLYSTLEPCAMCAGAIIHARVKELVYGANDPKAGGCGGRVDITKMGLFNHELKVTERALANECSEILKQFFRRLRARKHRTE
jgi:tRNA(adenine34) deaminase